MGIVRINITISEEDLKDIDVYCAKNRYSRSELLVLASLEKIDTVPEPKFSDTRQPPVSSSELRPHYGEQKEPKKGVYVNGFCEHGAAPGLCKFGCNV